MAGAGFKATVISKESQSGPGQERGDGRGSRAGEGEVPEEEKLMIKGRGGNLSPFDHAEDAIWAVVETRT